MQNKKLIAYLFAEKYVDDIFAHLEERYKVTLQKDIIIVELAKNEHIILFKYGVYISWNVSYENLKFFSDFMKPFEVDPLENPLIEEFVYQDGEEFKIHFDTITLCEDSELAKVSISHSLAQNIKLDQFEKQVQESIEQNSSIPTKLSKSGKIGLSKKELSKKIGELFLVKSKINLHYDLLDTPEFFWEYPEYENYYERMIKYLDIKPRVEVLNKKVEIIQELLDVISHEQNHAYSSFLEWIIIILIAFEIIMNLAEHI